MLAVKDLPDGQEVMRQLNAEMTSASPQAAHSMNDLSSPQVCLTLYLLIYIIYEFLLMLMTVSLVHADMPDARNLTVQAFQ